MQEKPIINTLTLGASVMLASVGLYFFGKALMNQIKRRRNAKDKENVDRGEENQVSQQQQYEQEQAKKYDPLPDAKSIRTYLSGNNFNSYGTEINDIFKKLTNAKLKKLAELYKNRYKISLYKQMDDEWNLCGWTKTDNCYEIPMKRLSGLGLR